MSSGLIGHQTLGSGQRTVIVLNDWLSCTSSWDPARPYLDLDRYTWVFADLRGYGRSRHLSGKYTVLEGARDVLDLAEALHASRWCVVGHSMSTLIALHLAQHFPDRVERAVLLCPPPPAGFGTPPEHHEMSRRLAQADVATKAAALAQWFEPRMPHGWTAFKAERWAATSEPSAAAAYVALFARDGVPEPKKRVTVPLLALTGEQDAPYMRREAVVAGYAPLCDRFDIASLAEAGHYPMQESPPLTVATVQRFLG